MLVADDISSSCHACQPSQSACAVRCSPLLGLHRHNLNTLYFEGMCPLILNWKAIFMCIISQLAMSISDSCLWEIFYHCTSCQLVWMWAARNMSLDKKIVLFLSLHSPQLTNINMFNCNIYVISAAVWYIYFFLNQLLHKDDLLLPLHDDYKYDKPCKLFEGICL